MSSDPTKGCRVSQVINESNKWENDRLAVILVKRLSRTSGLVGSEALQGGSYRNFSSTSTGATQS